MRSLLLTVAGVVLLPVTALATTVVPATLGDLAASAQIIVRGQVVALDTTWTDDHRAIETLVTLATDEYVKGRLGATLQFRVPGGRLGRFQSIMIGAPQFTVGDRAVLFLGARGPSLPYVLGLNQGVFRITLSDAGWMVSPPGIMATGSRAPIVRGDPVRRPLALSEFVRQVRTLTGRQP